MADDIQLKAIFTCIMVMIITPHFQVLLMHHCVPKIHMSQSDCQERNEASGWSWLFFYTSLAGYERESKPRRDSQWVLCQQTFLLWKCPTGIYPRKSIFHRIPCSFSNRPLSVLEAGQYSPVCSTSTSLIFSSECWHFSMSADTELQGEYQHLLLNYKGSTNT